VAGKIKMVDPDDPLIIHLKNMGTSFGT